MLSEEPEVSVVVCVLNASTTIRRQLAALSRQVDAPPFEVVVADNGSTDATVRVVQEWLEAGIGAAVSARIVDASARTGIAYARNTGVRSSHGRLLAFCDADDMVDDRWVSAVARSAISRKDGAIGGRVMLLGPGQAPSDQVVLDSLDGIRLRHGADGDECPYFWGCNFAMSKSTYLAVGGFDESLPSYGCEDIEIGLRLAAGGHPVEYEPTMVVFYAWPQGRRRKFRRNVRAGMAMACVWARHPEAFARRPIGHLVGRILTATVHELVAVRGSLRERSGRALDELSTGLGHALGELLWVRTGRLGEPQPYAQWPSGSPTEH